MTDDMTLEGVESLPTIEGLREALTKCRDKFAEYVELHRAKLDRASIRFDPEINAKIERNQEMVDLCNAALEPPRIDLLSGGGE